jgi:tellurite methyltransferase
VFNFLHRPLFRDIKDGLKPGGVVVYQTYLEEQLKFGKPRNPAHLLKPGELAQVFSEFEILRVNERVDSAVPGGPLCALGGIVARKPL